MILLDWYVPDEKKWKVGKCIRQILKPGYNTQYVLDEILYWKEQKWIKPSRTCIETKRDY